MFERPHHQRIARLLQTLNTDALRQAHCFFGGGTAIVLRQHEYRESANVDFICDAITGYRNLRTLVHDQGIDSLLTAPLPTLRPPRVDQYGIRCAVLVDQAPIKFEIIFEGRIALDDPAPGDSICGVAALTLEDLVATKLMANSDRWADDSVMSRDVIDLAMLSDTGELAAPGVEKAMRAYGQSVVEDLAKAKRHLLERDGRLRTCANRLSMRLDLDVLRERVARLTAQA